MALVLDSTVGGASANSYASLAEADAYHDGVIYNATWLAASDAQQSVALVHATRLLDEQVDWYGTKTTRTQALRWPRIGVSERDGASTFYDPGYGYYSIDSNIIPVWLKNATAELGRLLMVSDRTAEPDMLEFTQIQIGTLSLTKDSSRRKEVLPESVRVMVGFYGAVRTSGGVGVMKLVRA